MIKLTLPASCCCCLLPLQLTHSRLVVQQQQLEQVRQQLADATASVDGYLGLPASSLAAEMRVKQTREQLHATRAQLEKNLDKLHN